MTDVCYGCGRPVNKDPEVTLLENELRWYIVDDWEVGRQYEFGAGNYYGGLLKGERFTLLQKQTFTQESQGETTDCFLVFRREKTGKVYKKLGKGDSYGELEWDGALYEVKVAKKMVETWEVVD